MKLILTLIIQDFILFSNRKADNLQKEKAIIIKIIINLMNGFYLENTQRLLGKGLQNTKGELSKLKENKQI